MKKLKISWVALVATLPLLMAWTACKKDVEEKEEVHQYVYASQSDNSFFITTFKDFTEGTKTNFDKAITLPVGHLFMKVFDKHLFVMSGSMYGFGGEQTLYKYAISDNGRLSEKPVASLSFQGSPNVVEVLFASSTKAYGVTCGSKGELIIFDPSTMTQKGAISLAKYAKEDNDPDAGNGIIRDGKLFLPLNQAKSLKEIIPTPAELAVIDIATDKVEKVITDERATSLGMIGHTNPIMDEEGNIYIYTGPRAAMFEQMMPGKGFHEGMLRIKKGETDFDKDFFIALKDLEGGEVGSYNLFSSYAGNGKMYFFLFKPSLLKGQSEQDFITSKCYVPYELDLKTKTGKILPLPASNGWSASASVVVGDNVYFGIHADNGIGLYEYNIKTGKGKDKPTVETPSGVYKVLKLK